MGLEGDLLGAAVKPPAALNRAGDRGGPSLLCRSGLCWTPRPGDSLVVGPSGWLAGNRVGAGDRREGDLGGEAERRRSSIEGLNLSILDLVGDAKEGRLRRGEDCNVCDGVASWDGLAEVRRRFGADSSIAQG